ncbi:hypothetical protein BKH46_07820 [Helicobacter sp. 12S02634-8]|uniref:hypothetical protein n=1 Tax=Helicobacter sp. 12S02634-8 TaxID=1476199 RepID=UPI000BA6898B|nr:hypothetical protein [Helicobacter sp. 12S02634-8]PAF46368.1 hypothetical protein BKH46_07820 [Helicobacter sp. 12S02634-8]
MRVNEAVEIVNGKLAATPSISAFNGVATKIAEVKRGCLFIAKDPSEIDGAIALGAYGVVYDKYAQMVDGEIAWIRVDSIQDAMIRLVRYQFLRDNIEVFYVSAIEYAIASQIITDTTIGFFDDGLEEILSFMSKQVGLRSVVIKDEALLSLVLEYTQAVIPQELPFKVLVATLFDTKINYKLSHYTLKLPSLFLPELGSVIEMCVAHHIAFDLGRFCAIPYMCPYFINAHAHLVPYGQTDCVVVAEENIELYKKYAAYIASQAKWGKLVLLLPRGYGEVFDGIAPSEIYDSKDMLKELLMAKDYNFALIFGISEAELLEILMIPHHEPTLMVF